MSWKILVAALVGAILCAPAASAGSLARHPPKVRLALVPLQTGQLGPSGASLPIQFDSGTVSNQQVGPSAKKLGRLGGYLLDYGNAYSGGAGVTAIQTQIERFRTHAGAKKALKGWKESDKLVAVFYRSIGIAAGGRFFKVPAVGSGHFAFVMSVQVPGAAPLYNVDEEASSGSFILHATVEAGTESTAEHLAPVLMARLKHRLQQGLEGHLRGKPVKLPQLPTPGPPPGGPDLSQLVLGPPDFTGQAAVVDQGYEADPTALSTYGVELRPAGPFADVEQSINWYANANEVTWQGTLFADIFTSAGPVVDLSTAGDNAHAVIAAGVDQSGAAISLVFVVLWQGQALDVAVAEGPTTIQPSDVQTLAQAMATHLNAGFPAASAFGYAPTTWTSQRLSRSRSSSMKRTRCQVPSWSSPSRTGTDSPAVPSSMAMQWEWPLPWSMSSGQMFSVRRSQSSCA